MYEIVGMGAMADDGDDYRDFSILLWDDSGAQCFELELFADDEARRARCAFRVWHADGQRRPGVPPRRMAAPREGGEMRRFLGGETGFRLEEIARSADQLACVATFLATAGSLEPLTREFRLRVQRNVFVPQVRIELTIDGGVYLPKSAAVPGHNEMTLRFWTTDEALLAFAEALDDAAVELGAYSRWADREVPATPATAKLAAPTKAAGGGHGGKRRHVQPTPASPLSPLELELDAEAADDDLMQRLFYWEEFEESLSNPEQQRREDEEWERLNEEWLTSHMKDRRRRFGRGGGAAAADGDEEDEAEAADAESAVAVDPFVQLAVAERLPELPSPSEEAEALSAIRDAKDPATPWLEMDEETTRRQAQRDKQHVDTRTGLVWPGTINAEALAIPAEAPPEQAPEESPEQAEAPPTAETAGEAGEAVVVEATGAATELPGPSPAPAPSQRELSFPAATVEPTAAAAEAPESNDTASS